MSSPDTKRAPELDEWMQKDTLILEYEERIKDVQLNLATCAFLASEKDETLARVFRLVIKFASARTIKREDDCEIWDYVASLCRDAQNHQYSYDSVIKRASKGGKARAEQIKEQRRESSDSDSPSEYKSDVPAENKRFAHPSDA